MKKIFFGILFLSLSLYAYDIDPSGYSLYSGGKFYVLTDGVFASNEEIKVRFEASGNSSQLAEYGGVDVRLYRIPKPLEFLKTQKNLHRPDVKGKYEGEGLSNVLTYLWDSWYKKSRLAWQRVFSTKAREAAVREVPELKQTPGHTYKTKFTHENQFRPLDGMEIVESFRYPIWQAQTVQPPKDTTMEGSSSNFIRTPAGNVLLPMGKRAPGLYLVEAIIGTYRATTLVFVSDSLVVTKVSANQGLVWTVDKVTGQAKGQSKVTLTDGVGVLDQGKANDDGVYISKREIPERTYAMIEDASGGVSISENFFFPSEVYQPKIYVFTDRPLYQPGDLVSVRAFGRNVKPTGAADVWSSLTGKSAEISIVDAAGVMLINKKLSWRGIEGSETQIQLPTTAESGGYSIQFRLDGEDYGASFRVARFTKPHFDAQIIYEKPSYKVGEAIKGHVILTYPSGQPVAGAEVDLQLQSEKMTVFEGNYAYNEPAKLELKKNTFKSNAKGEVPFSFPAMERPSRLITSARAFDQAAYRVTTKKEILVEGYLETYILKSDFNATEPGQAFKIQFDRQGSDAGEMSQKLKTWQVIRLEDREVSFGPLPDLDKGEFTLNLNKPGHYVVRVVDAGGVTRGVRTHVVIGPGLKASEGEIEILQDKEAYKIGETAHLILTFPNTAEDALITFERNEVSSHGLLSKGSSWFQAKKLNASQWKVDVPVLDRFAPNIIFSVAYARNGEFIFQNKGLVVQKPMIEINMIANKKTYLPGEKVTVDIETKYEGQPISAMLAIGVVDEMIYVLQPEIAPSMGDFFHHLRRNQVRTTSSLSFYSFNPATSDVVPPDSTSAHRDLKLLQERARRDAQDTAYWNGSLKTDAKGKVRIEFKMPDALTRWRITARAIALQGQASEKGAVGDSKSYILSNQEYYLKWTGPRAFREGDKPKPAMVAFNSTNRPADGEIQIKSNGESFTQKVKLRPGANTVVLEKTPQSSTDLESRLVVGGRSADLLSTPLVFQPSVWRQTQSAILKLDGKETFNFPNDARKIRIKVMSDGSSRFLRIVDDLLEYPWGCVEQISSRLIPLVMAAKALDAKNSKDPMMVGMVDRIASERRKLVGLAGPDAAFTWWGDIGESNLMLTAHAYHADFRASKLLGIEVPKSDWEHLLKIYSNAKNSTVFDRAYALWVISYLGLPINEQLGALMKNFKVPATPVQLAKKQIGDSNVLDATDVADDQAVLLMGILAAKSKLAMPAPLQARLQEIIKAGSNAPDIQAAILDYHSQNKNAKDLDSQAESILEKIRYETPTIDRALTLAFLEEASPKVSKIQKSSVKSNLGANWSAEKGNALSFVWKGPGVPKSLPIQNGLSAEIIYDSTENIQRNLPINVTRKIYKVNFAEEEGQEDISDGLDLSVSEVALGEPLDSRALYLDEISLEPKVQSAQFLFLEVPLPPGGEVDGKTWGLDFNDVKTNFMEPRTTGQGLGYGISIEKLDGPLKVHQLVRFSSRGQFALPPVKLTKMYRPSERTYEMETKARAIQVQ
jgi:hypothetical protein